jgi:putative ABC transport system permease protein
MAVTDGFFEALGVAMRAGRAFAPSDLQRGDTVILGESLARRLFADRNAIGSRVRLNGRPHDVIGIVADYTTNPLGRHGRDHAIFVPLVEAPDMTRISFVVRAAGDPAPIIQSLRRELPGAPAGTTVSGAFAVDEILDVGGREILVGTAPLVPLIVIGMALTTMGVYGVLAFALTRRSRELAVRVAVGANPSDMVRLVAVHTARLVCLGAGIGLALTFALSRVVRAGGGAGGIFDPPPLAFAAPILIVLAIALLATWIPARRAMKIDPVTLLRTG